jgi:hypothetical protein
VPLETSGQEEVSSDGCDGALCCDWSVLDPPDGELAGACCLNTRLFLNRRRLRGM